MSNPTGDRVMNDKTYRNNVKGGFDFSGNCISIVIEEASIHLGMPKKILKNFTEAREW